MKDWEWQVKEKLGERNLPMSFIKYHADKNIGRWVDSGFIDPITPYGFLADAILSAYMIFFYHKTRKKNNF